MSIHVSFQRPRCAISPIPGDRPYLFAQMASFWGRFESVLPGNIALETEREIVSLFEAIRCRPPQWVPDSVKVLFRSALVVDSVDDLLFQLNQPAIKHLLWKAQPGVLVAFEREGDAHFSLKMIGAPIDNQDAHVGGGAFSLLTMALSHFTPGLKHSEWTSSFKTRIDPVCLCYRHLPRSTFSPEFFALWNQTSPDLFALLESFREKAANLPRPLDEKGYHQRFMTKPRGSAVSWWLYKAWMRSVLPLEDYKKFHFLHRYTLMTGNDVIVPGFAAKLLRSLHKGKVVFEKDARRQVTNLLEWHASQKQQNSQVFMGQNCLMPIIRSLTPSVAAPSFSPAPVISPIQNVAPHQWHPHLKSIQRSFPPINSPEWDLSAYPNKYQRICDFKERYFQGKDQHPLEAFEKLVIFKRLFSQWNRDFAESLIFMGPAFLETAFLWEDDEQSYALLQQYWEELRPKAESFWIRQPTIGRCEDYDPKQPPASSAERACAQKLFESVEGTSAGQIPEGHLEAMLGNFLWSSREYHVFCASSFGKWWNLAISLTIRPSGLSATDSSSGGTETTGVSFSWHPHRLVLKNPENVGSSHHQTLTPGYLTESKQTEKAFCQVSTVLFRILPYQAPELVLLSYAKRHFQSKYKSNQDFSYLFQEAWVAEEFQRKYPKGSVQPSQEFYRDLFRARASGILPLYHKLKDPLFRKFVENFLQKEFETLMSLKDISGVDFNIHSLEYGVSDFLTLCSLLIHSCKELKLPPIESVQEEWIATFSKRYLTYEKKERFLRIRGLLFWLYAEKGDFERAQTFRLLKPIELANFYGYDRRRIEYFLQLLPDLDPSISVYEPFESFVLRNPSVSPSVKVELPPLDGKMRSELESRWWDGSKVVLFQDETTHPDPYGWQLEEAPGLYWRPGSSSSLYQNALVDPSGEIQEAIFHHYLEGTRISFAIPYQRGNYYPRRIEESLALLLAAVKGKDAALIGKISESLPLELHTMTAQQQNMILEICQRVDFSQKGQLEEIGLILPLLQKFLGYFQNPTLGVDPEHLERLEEMAGFAWKLYRDVHQNISQEALIPVFAAEQLKTLTPQRYKKEILEGVTQLVKGVPQRIQQIYEKGIKPYLERTAVRQHQYVWKGEPLFLSKDTTSEFWAKEKEMASSYYPRNLEISRIQRGIAFVQQVFWIFVRAVGIPYHWEEKIEYFTSLNLPDNLFPKKALDAQEKIEKRIELATFKKEQGERVDYACAVLDFAIEKGFFQKENETPGQFLSRVDAKKHTGSFGKYLLSLVLGNCFQLLQLIGFIRDWYPRLPKTVTLPQTSERAPFELFVRPQHNPAFSSDGVFQTQEQILQFANYSSPERETLLVAGLAQHVTWEHLVGLFAQNGMRRVSTINSELSQEDCDEIDSLMRLHLIHASQAQRCYDPSEESEVVRALLVLEYMSGMTVRPQQAEKLKTLLTKTHEGKYASLAMQMGMGEGKTSVLASLVLFLAAKPGRLSVFIPPDAQFDTLSSMLTRSQKMRFFQEVIPIHMPFEVMQELSSLKWLSKKLELAKQLGHVILLHPRTLHNLRLSGMTLEDPEKLEVLFVIRNALKENADALIDEIDLVLDPLKDSSMAVGIAKSVKSSHIALFAELMKLHAQDPVLWQALCHNRPEEIDDAAYLRFQKEIIAPKLSERFPMPAPFKESFCRYVCDKIEQQDRPFLDWLGSSSDRDQIALYKHWLSEILPFTIQRERGRHFGRALESAAIVPYSGVSSPTTTKFSTLFEDLSYYFLTALSSELTASHFSEVVSDYQAKCEVYQVKSLFSVLETLKKEFFSLTGCSLEEIQDPEREEKAREYVNLDPLRRLECEKILAKKHIQYFEQEITSTSQDLLSMVSTHRGFSGVFPGFLEAFDQIIVPDTQADARLEKTILEHQEEIRAVSHLKDFFFHLDRQESPLGGLIDTGALFRDSTNEQVAEAILRELPHIQTVLFFTKKTPQDPSPDTPALMRRLQNGKTLVQIIGATDPQTLHAFGVKQESLFVYYDQRHSEAVDVAQLPERRNVLTIGLKTTYRDVLQGVMRLRKYQDKSARQRVTFALLESTQQALFGTEPLTAKKLLDKTKEIQTQETKTRSYRTYYHRINAAFATMIEDYVALHYKDRKKCAPLRAFFKQQLVGPSPYLQYGGVSVESHARDHILNYLKEKTKAFAHIYPGSLPESLKKTLHAIERSLRTNEHLPSTIKVSKVGSAQQRQVQQQQEQQQSQETHWVLPNPGKGNRWKEQLDYRVISLSEHYAKIPLVSGPLEKDLFSDLSASENWIHTYQTAYPLNHPDQKRVDYLLLTQKGTEIKATILSGYDYHNYDRKRKPLPDHSVVCVWMGQQFHPLLGDATLLLQDTPILSKIKIQIAFLNAEAAYLLKNPHHLKGGIGPFHTDFLRQRVLYWSDRQRPGKLEFQVFRVMGNAEEDNITTNSLRGEVLNIVNLLEQD